MGLSLAVVATGIALGVSVSAPVVFQPNPFLLFFLAVAISARYGGFGPGVLATTLGALASWYFLLPSVYLLPTEMVLQLVRVAGMVLVSLLITSLSADLRGARRRASRARDAAEDAVQHLQAALHTAAEAQQAAVSAAEREQVAVREQMRLRDDAIRELSTPLLQVRQGILVLPLIGALDSERATGLRQRLLIAIRDMRARAVVMDVTGMNAIDAGTTVHLLEVIQAASLLGAAVIVSGLSARISGALSELAVDLSGLHTAGDLEGALEYATHLLDDGARPTRSRRP